MILNESEKKTLKKPFGKLLSDGTITKGSVIHFIRNCKILVSVGDETTSLLLKFGIIPTISVTDGKTMRQAINISQNRKYRPLIEYLQDDKIPQLNCNNPAGSVSDEAYRTVIKSIEKGCRVKILVNGEEDLLAIPFFAFLPKESVVAYGQPSEGLVLTRINSAIQSTAKDLLTRFDLPI